MKVSQMISEALKSAAGRLTISSVKRAGRTFLVTAFTLFLPGLLGWLNSLTSWATSNGVEPFPAVSGLAWLAISAIVAGLVASVNLMMNFAEDLSGRSLWRQSERRPEAAIPEAQSRETT